MADDHDERDPQWGNTVARWTFLFTVILAVLYCGAVFIFILR